MGQGVQGAGLAGVGTAGKGHFIALVGRTLVDLGSTDGEFGLLAEAEDGVFDLHGISGVGVARGRLGKRCRFRFSNGSI
ncbi:hypothetical protein D9M71_289570 [compost metagenome]